MKTWTVEHHQSSATDCWRIMEGDTEIAVIRQNGGTDGRRGQIAAQVAAMPEMLELLRRLETIFEDYVPYRDDGWQEGDRENYEAIRDLRALLARFDDDDEQEQEQESPAVR